MGVGIRGFVVLVLATFLGSACAPLVIGGAAATGAAVHDRRSVGTVLDDQGIELEINKLVLQDPALKGEARIRITSFNRVVLLTGEAPTAELKQRAEKHARSLADVRQVHNEIRIAAPAALSTRTSDSWITAKAKTSLLKVKLKKFDPTRVKVVTNNGTVFLMGLVSPVEAEEVVSVVRQVNGVQRVVKVFEYDTKA